MEKMTQNEYIKYLEDRLEKLSGNLSVGNYDLNVLVDTQNEVIINSARTFKRMLGEDHNNLSEKLCKKMESYDNYVAYLTNSPWWKLTWPFRIVARKIKNNSMTACRSFDYSGVEEVEGKVGAIIYATKAEGLENQIKNIKGQSNIKQIDVGVVDLCNSKSIYKIATSNNVKYINLSLVDDEVAMARKILCSDARYVIYIGQELMTRSKDWLYTMVLPLEKKYTTLSTLYDKSNPQILSLKKELFFNGIKNRLVNVEQHYECLLLPKNRSVQYVPFSIMSEAICIAKAL